MINAIIVDDEHANRELMQNLLQVHCPSVKIVGTADGIAAAYEEIVNKKPNLVFLDIQMPNGNGFQLLEKFKEIFFDIIFVTSFDQYAINAIKFSALDYLLKPMDITELKAAVEKAHKKVEKENKFKLYENLLNNINPNNVDKKMAIRVKNDTIFIQMSSVSYMQADGNYSNIHLINGTKYYISKTLKEIDEFTADLKGFIRINKSVIVNSSQCSKYQKGEIATLTLKTGETFEISRRKKVEVLDKLNALLKG
jgi:two-component system, LytTR family, response regulator